MKFSTMLKGIRNFFKPERYHTFVCVKLESKYGSEAQPLLDYIQESIGCKTYEDKLCKSVIMWVKENHLDFYETVLRGDPHAQQAYRLAWIDQMIEMFEAEGN